VELPPFSVTWDYRCPFAFNANEHLLTALQDGVPWEVTFVPFSLNQSHVPEGEPPVWEDPVHEPDLLALKVAVVVRDRYPDRFLEVHRALFSARFDKGKDLRDEGVISACLDELAVSAGDVLAEVKIGWPGEELRRSHEQAVAEHSVFGVPTFIVGDRAAFARLMNTSNGDANTARTTIERVVSLISGHSDLNELKHTTISK